MVNSKQTRPPRVRLQDIADRAGVSKMTASLVLNSRQFDRVKPETRSRVEAIARECGYRPNQAARQLTGKKSQIIGVLMPHNARDFALHRFRAIDLEAMKRGMRLMAGHVSAGDGSLDACLDDFSTRNVEGIIWMGHAQFSADNVARVGRDYGPVVLIGESVDSQLPFVSLDLATATADAVRHLVQTGRSRIGIVFEHVTWYGQQQRLDGYKAALLEAGITIDERWIWQPTQAMAELDKPPVNAAPQIIEHVIRECRVDAIIAPNDLWAAAIARVARQAGIGVPDDLAIVGQDNSELAEFFDPPLTSIDLQPALLAQNSLELLLDEVEQGVEPQEGARSRAVPLTLKVRESTCCSSKGMDG